MNTFLRYLVYCFIVLYIIGWIRLVSSRILEYILGSQGTHEGVVVRCRRPLPWMYLIRIKAKDVDIEPRFLPLVPDRFKIQEMCEKAVKKCLWLLKYVPDWFVTHQQMKIWCDDDEYCNYDKLIEWYKGYQKRKAQKAQIRKELMPIAWHPSRCWNWCIPEDEKKETEKLKGSKKKPQLKKS